MTEPIKAVIGEYADYFDTGLWTFKNGVLFAPDDLTVDQLKDHLLACGGFVYLHENGQIAWANRTYMESSKWTD